MDAVLFKSGQKLEHLQVQIGLITSHTKELYQQYIQLSKSLIVHLWSSPRAVYIKTNIREVWQYIIKEGLNIKQKIWLYVDPKKLYYNLAKVFWNKWTKRDVCFLAAGFVSGSIFAVLLTLALKRKQPEIQYMQAVQCISYLGIESAMVVENAKAPIECGNNDVMITVKAASVHVIDAEICTGYGQNLRRILQKIYSKKASCDLPITLGRDCSGIITDVGANVKKLEVGDEVWAAVPFWFEGTMSQTVVVPASWVGRKPKTTGFEGACSLPYAGSVALRTLKDIRVYADNAQSKSFLVVGGCTPVGCVLIQILKNWKTTITTTCTKRAVPVVKALGATDIIIWPESAADTTSNTGLSKESVQLLEKEIALRDKFDHVIITRNVALMMENIVNLCKGNVVSTMPHQRRSDSCGIISSLILRTFIYLQYIFEKILGLSITNFNEADLSNLTLDTLTDMVESGRLQTVVDKVFLPKDIDIALNHIQSSDSIGSTIITFR